MTQEEALKEIDRLQAEVERHRAIIVSVESSGQKRNENEQKMAALAADYRAQRDDLHAQLTAARKQLNEVMEVYCYQRNRHELEPNLPDCECPVCNVHRKLTAARAEVETALVERDTSRQLLAAGRAELERHLEVVQHLAQAQAALASCREVAGEMKVALQWYAGGNHYEEDTEWNCAKMGDLPPPPKLLDRGEVAQAVLGKFEG